MRIPTLLLTVLLGLAASCAPAGARHESAPAPPTAAVSDAERVVQAQLEAYNRRDIDAFLATYAPDVRIYDHPDRLQLEGLAAMRERYGPMFERVPDLHAAIERRIVQGDYVIDHERVTGLPDGRTIRAVAIYQVRDGRIQNVWFIQ